MVLGSELLELFSRCGTRGWRGESAEGSFGSDSFQFLPAAVKLRNIFSGSSELRIKHLPMLAVLGVKIRVGKLRFEADDIFLRSQDLVLDRF